MIVVNDLTFVTGNAAKAEQLRWHLAVPLRHQAVDLPEIQSLDLEEVVGHKAREAYKVIGAPVLVEDTSLSFVALKRLPGPLIKWFLHELGNDGLCHLLDGYEQRGALAQVLFGWYDGQQLRCFSGAVHGAIAPEPKGVSGFGWDNIFIPQGETKTWGEMNREEQTATSMRRIALGKLTTAMQPPGRG
jgi:non-canonical purine NTP pyrophosphatase (RdgB/HAM1 family)